MLSKHRLSTSRGFTLLEFAVVVTVVGVLMAVAVPRLADLQTPARQSQLKSTLGALRSAAALFHAQCVTRLARDGSNSCAVLAVEGATIEGAGGYPAATLKGIATMAGLRTNSETESGFVLSERRNETPAALVIEIPGPTPGGCRLLYREPATPGAAPDIEVISTPCN